MPRRLTALAITLFCLFLAACSGSGPIKAYTGPAIDPSRLATLEVPQALEVVYLDQREADLPMVLDDPYLLQLKPGRHSIHFAYVVDRGTARQYEYASSALMAVSFEAVARRRYRLDYRQPERLSADQPLNAELVDLDSGARLPAAAVGQYRSALNRYLFRASPPPAPALDTPRATPLASDDAAPLARLQHWWQLASEAERAEFLNWIVRQ